MHCSKYVARRSQVAGKGSSVASLCCSHLGSGSILTRCFHSLHNACQCLSQLALSASRCMLHVLSELTIPPPQSLKREFAAANVL